MGTTLTIAPVCSEDAAQTLSSLTVEHTGSSGPLRALASRVEVSGETVFFYTQDAAPLMQALAHEHTLRSLHRPANLEDLFLKLTGRQIREDA